MTTVERVVTPHPGRAFTLGPLAAAALICLGAGLIGFTAGQRGIVVIAALTVVAGGIAIALQPDRATLVVVAILYSNAAAIAVQQHGLPYFAGAAFPFLLVVPFAYHVVVRREPVVVAGGLPFVVAFFLILVLGTLTGMSADPDRALSAFTTFVVEGLLIYVVVTNVVRSFEIARQIVWVLLLVGAFLGALSVHQQLTGNFASDYMGFAKVSEASIDPDPIDRSGGQPRLAGPIGEKNRYAQIMIVLVPLGLFRVWGERRRLLQLAAAGATVLIGAGAMLTFSRGAALGLGVTVGLMVALRYIRTAQLVPLVVAVAVLLWSQPQYTQRLLTLEAVAGATTTRGESAAEDNSIRKRANEMIAALLVFGDHPIIGVGRGLFPVYYLDYGGEVGIANEFETRQAHNLAVGIAAETGILGLVSFAGVFLVTLRDLARVRRRRPGDDPQAMLATGFALAIVAYVTTGLFLHLSYERFLWLLLALAGAVAWLGLRWADPVSAGRAPTGR